MANTIRDRSALLVLLDDNTRGAISAQDMRDVLVSLHGVYGAIYVADGSTAQGSLNTTPVLFTGFAANGPAAGTTPDHTNDKITVGTDGVYLVWLQVSFSGTAAETFELHIRKNGADSGFGCHRKMGTAGDVGSASVVGLISCSANDVITVYVNSLGVGGTDSITPVDAQLVVYRVA